MLDFIQPCGGAMGRFEARGGTRAEAILRERPALREEILAQMDADGALGPRAFAGDEVRDRSHWGWNWSDAKHVLEYLFDIGEVAVAGRNSSFERRYDRAERVLPAHVRAEPELDHATAHDVLVGRAARALGVADLEALSAYFYLKKDAVRAAIGRLVARGELEPVHVAGLEAQHWLWHEARRPRSWHAQALVSPFDSWPSSGAPGGTVRHALPHRDLRAPAQRRYGYYVYLFFLGDAPPPGSTSRPTVAGASCASESAWLEPHADAQETARALAWPELQAMAGWLGLGEVAVARAAPWRRRSPGGCDPPERSPPTMEDGRRATASATGRRGSTDTWACSTS
jgi:uncharacterized protein YcaQ